MDYIRAVDCSNYTTGRDGEIDAVDTARARDAGIHLAIVQALTPPTGYPFPGDGQHCRRQVQAWQASGVSTDAYLYWIIGGQPIREKIRLMEGESIRQWWVDFEEKPALQGDALTAQIRSALLDADTAPCTLGRPAGAYLAHWWLAWYQQRGGSLEPFLGRPVWWVQWTGKADPTIVSQIPPELGRNLCIVQYTGTNSVGGVNGVDLDVLTSNEGSTLDVNVPEVPQDYRQKFALSGPYDWPGVVANLEGIIHELQSTASQPSGSSTTDMVSEIQDVLRRHGYQVTDPNSPPVVEPQSFPDQGAAPSDGAPDSAPVV